MSSFVILPGAALVLAGSLVGCLPVEDSADTPAPARIEWALSLNGQPATCRDYQVDTVVVYVAGTGAGPCERSEDFPYPIECTPLRYEVPCDAGALEQVFEAPVDTSHSVSITLHNKTSHLGDLYLPARRYNLEQGGVFTYPVQRATLDVSWSLAPQPQASKLLVQFYERSYTAPFTPTGSTRLLVPAGLRGTIDAYVLPPTGAPLASVHSPEVTMAPAGTSVTLTQSPST